MKRNDNERKRREKLIGELQESNDANEKLIKLRRNLIQNVTHELRTPLAAISGNAVTEDGFGLGLAIVADTVKLLKGNITVESEPGKGSRFTVSLPLAKAEETEIAEKKQESHISLSGYNILAIDNDAVLLDMLHDMYRQHDMECDTCQSVDELTDLMRINKHTKIY